MLRFSGLVLLLVVAGCASNPSMTGPNGGVDAGGPPGTCPPTEDNDDLIAKFTDDNGIHPTADGRSGGFYVYGDTLGMFDPPKMGDDPYPIDMNKGNPYCSGPGSFHVKSMGFAEWGSAMGTDFKPMLDGFKDSYDASQYKGISFWATASAEVSFVQVKFPDVNTDSSANPAQVVMSTENPTAALCALASGFPNNCSPYLVKLDDNDFPNYVGQKIDQKWRQFKIAFADTQQDKYNAGQVGPGNKLDVKHLLGFAIQVNANFSTTPATANNSEIWIDDVEFFR